MKSPGAAAFLFGFYYVVYGDIMSVKLLVDYDCGTGTVIFDGLPLYSLTGRGTFRNYWDPDPALLLGAMLLDTIGGMTSG